MNLRKGRHLARDHPPAGERVKFTSVGSDAKPGFFRPAVSCNAALRLCVRPNLPVWHWETVGRSHTYMHAYMVSEKHKALPRLKMRYCFYLHLGRTFNYICVQLKVLWQNTIVWGAYKPQKTIIQSSPGWQSVTREPVWSDSSEDLFGCDFLGPVSRGGEQSRESELSHDFWKSTNPARVSSTSMTSPHSNTFQRPDLLIPSHWGSIVWIYECWETQTSCP